MTTYDIESASLGDFLATVRVTDQDYIQVRPEPDGWHVFSVDAAHVSLVSACLSASAFGGYEAGEPFAFEAARLADLVGEGDRVVLEVTDRIRARAGAYSRVIPLDALEESEARIPRFDTTASAVVSSDPIRRFVSKAPKGLALLGVRIGPEGVVLSAKAWQALEMDSLEIPAETDGGSEGEFDRRYVHDLMAAVPKGALVTLASRTGYPLTAEWARGMVVARAMVAPRYVDDGE